MALIPVLTRSEAVRLRAGTLLTNARELRDQYLDVIAHARYLRSIRGRYRNIVRQGLAPLA